MYKLFFSEANGYIIKIANVVHKTLMSIRYGYDNIYPIYSRSTLLKNDDIESLIARQYRKGFGLRVTTSLVTSGVFLQWTIVGDLCKNGFHFI